MILIAPEYMIWSVLLEEMVNVALLVKELAKMGHIMDKVNKFGCLKKQNRKANQSKLNGFFFL